jgi:hypothetical protein
VPSINGLLRSLAFLSKAEPLVRRKTHQKNRNGGSRQQRRGRARQKGRREAGLFDADARIRARSVLAAISIWG